LVLNSSTARRDHLFGLWAAEKLGTVGPISRIKRTTGIEVEIALQAFPIGKTSPACDPIPTTRDADDPIARHRCQDRK
jgi:hypothetical protein